MFLQQLLLTILQIGLLTVNHADAQTEAEMIGYLADYDLQAKQLCNKNVHANWNVQTDVMNASLVVEQVRVKAELKI
jgi:LPS O-antigen subunit length determinant protein (WzzB/FepE family)